MSLQYAKESIVLDAIKDIQENQKHMQEVNLQSSIVWKGKALDMTAKLADALQLNSRLTALDLTDCSINDAALSPLTRTLAGNASLFHLALSKNKFGRPALHELGTALATNTGLISLELMAIRIDSAVCACFQAASGQHGCRRPCRWLGTLGSTQSAP